MGDTTAISWSTVAATGLKKRVLFSPSRHRHSTTLSITPKVIFTSPDFNQQLLARKAASILQKTIAPGSLLFSFPSNLLPVHTQYYEAIEQQIGKAQGFLPISLYSSKKTPGLSKDFLLQVKFADSAHSQIAVDKGITIKDIVYKATPSSANASARFVRVHITLLDIPDEATMIPDLLSSLRYYGNVHQITKMLCNGHFENQLTVLMDTSMGYTLSSGETHPHQPLSRNLYMEKWNCHVPASFRGAPPMCYFCTKEGHVKNQCPALAKIKCFRCNHHGHTSRHCDKEEEEEEVQQPPKTLTDAELIKEYEDASARLEETKDEQAKATDGQAKAMDDQAKTADDQAKGKDEQANAKALIPEPDQPHSPRLIDSTMTEVTTDPKTVAVVLEFPKRQFDNTKEGGSIESKHASIMVARRMAVDETNSPQALIPVSTNTSESADNLSEDMIIDPPESRSSSRRSSSISLTGL